jgi:hypothetical protein
MILATSRDTRTTTVHLISTHGDTTSTMASH